MAKNVVRFNSFRDLLPNDDERQSVSVPQKPKKVQPSRPLTSVATNEVRSDLPLNTCLNPVCKSTFRLPWGYHEGVKPEKVTGEDWNKRILPMWPGACSGPCFSELMRLQQAQRQKQEDVFLARFQIQDQ